MSFGRPGYSDAFKPTPPQRGSFPLDHDGECKTVMMEYLQCLRANAGDNGKCRLQSKHYLECRMDHGLMRRDDMGNLGLGDVAEPDAPPPNPQHVPQAPTNSAPAVETRI